MTEENEADAILSAVSLINSNDKDQTTSNIRTNSSLIVDPHVSGCSVVLSINNDGNNNNDDTVPVFSIRTIYKNLLTLSCAFVLLFVAYNGITILQSSLNTKHNVGINSLIISNACVIFSSILLTGTSINILGLKWSIIFAEAGYVSYVAANIYPQPSLMYISAALVGLAAGPLWTAKATYLKRIACYHAQHKHKKVEVSVSLFFGVFFALLGTSTIWGNIISYFVLNQSSYPEKVDCGIYFDPRSSTSANVTGDVSDTARYILCGIFTGMGILSMVLPILILDRVELSERQSIVQSLKMSFDVLTSLFRWKYVGQFNLIPLAMWTQIQSGFLTAQITRAFITCLIGIRYVGLIMISYGICQSSSSYLFGYLVKYIGRVGCFVVASLLNYAMILSMFFWQMHDNQMLVLFVIVSVWGIADGIWQSQVFATYTIFYSESDSNALAKYRLWNAIGSVVSFSFANYVTIRLSLILLLIYLTVAMILYGIVEIRRQRKSSGGKSNSQVDSIR